jgi:RNA polymerase sigma-70 factor, ECF subfamily
LVLTHSRDRRLELVSADPEEGGLEFEDFYLREYQQVFRATYLLVGSREGAQDATQEAFKRAFVRWGRLRKQPWVGGWVMTTALNLCKRQLQDANRDLSPASKRPDLISAPSVRVDVVNALRKLPHRQQQATVLYYVGDLPLPVIADLMGITEGAVKAHLAHARKSLRELLEVTDA